MALEIDYLAVDFGPGTRRARRFCVRGVVCDEQDGLVVWRRSDPQVDKAVVDLAPQPTWLGGSGTVVPDRARARAANEVGAGLISSVVGFAWLEVQCPVFLALGAEVEIETLHRVVADQNSALNKLIKRFGDSVALGAKATGKAAALTSFTERETQILSLAAQDRSNEQISKDLGLSPFTVKDHIQRSALKLSIAHKGHAIILTKLLNFI